MVEATSIETSPACKTLPPVCLLKVWFVRGPKLSPVWYWYLEVLVKFRYRTLEEASSEHPNTFPKIYFMRAVKLLFFILNSK